MKNLFTPDALAEVLSRIEKLQPSSQRKWGKMDVAQMLAHCTAALDVAIGRTFPPRMLIGRILGPLIKSNFYNEKPFNKNGPTDKNFVVADQRDFSTEKARLVQGIKQFSVGGPTACTTHPHSFFGELTPGQWSIGMYKHLDHHLRQFGV
ncbi:DUF1569 domain-containing protein [Spirosoma sp. HMF3257]|uniref:DUF1569 domain-containing protein n=1 Tax=Spirosoma telluris TaxID=2183553 RepID=A0A327NUM7_9BACT|nr:DUF1569 domain-containing protein [Spirosoma telluris]RAI77706.1 hypothetical protein HMF3257_32670 [Spirosoma telluris]